MRNGQAYWEQSRAPLVAERIRHFRSETGGTALDVGCGSGALTRELADDFDRIIGADIDISAVSRQPVSGPPFIVADAALLPVKSGSISFVFSYGALHHTDARTALTEIARVVAPGGGAVLIDFCDTSSSGKFSYFRHLEAVFAAFSAYRRRLGIRGALRILKFRLSRSWIRHLQRDTFLTPDDFLHTYGSVLPGAHFCREENLMTVIWRQSLAT